MGYFMDYEYDGDEFPMKKFLESDDGKIAIANIKDKIDKMSRQEIKTITEKMMPNGSEICSYHRKRSQQYNWDNVDLLILELWNGRGRHKMKSLRRRLAGGDL